MSTESGSDETYGERRDKVTVNGYIRHYFMNQDIPQDIINLCFLFYHIMFQDTFKHFNTMNYVKSHNGIILTYKRSQDASHESARWTICYG